MADGDVRTTRELHAEGPSDVAPVASKPDEPVLRFRNYKPRDDALPHAKIEPAARPSKLTSLSSTEVAPPTAEPLLNLAPKKPNWDLHRDIETDLAKLDRQTELAIVELLRRRIAEESGAGGQAGPDLAAAVLEQEHAERLADDDIE